MRGADRAHQRPSQLGDPERLRAPGDEPLPVPGGKGIDFGEQRIGVRAAIPVALFLGALGLAVFLWSLRSGQYDDLDGAAVRVLIDDEP